MEYFVSLITDRPLETTEIRSWYSACKALIPDTLGVYTNAEGKETKFVIQRLKSGKFKNTIPLNRHLDNNEKIRVSNAITSDEPISLEFSEYVKPIFDYTKHLSGDDIKAINTELSKVQHRNWVETKIQDGWQHGPFDPINKRSPLLTNWDHIPDESKFVDETMLATMINILSSYGIVLDKK